MQRNEVVIEKLEFPYNVQKKSGMYGADGTNADILFREIVDNTVDLALKFRQSVKVKALINKDGWNYVEDNGLGLPLYLDKDFPDFDQPILIDMMRKINVGSNITKVEYSSGTNGVGSKLAIALSEYFFFIVNASKKDKSTLPKFLQEELDKGNSYYLFRADDGHFQYQKVLDKDSLIKYFSGFPEDIEKAIQNLDEDFGTVAIFKPSLKYLDTDKVTYHGYPFKLMKSLFKYDKDLANINVEFSLNGKPIEPYSFKSEFNDKLLEDKIFHQSVIIPTEEKHPIRFIYEIGYSLDKFNFDFDGSANLLKTPNGKHISLVQSAVGIAFHKFNSLISPNDAKLGQRLFVLNFAVGHLFNSQDKTKLSKFEDRGYDEKKVLKALSDSFYKLMEENADYFNLLCQRILEYKKATDKLSNIELLKSKIVLGDEGDRKRAMSGEMAKVYDCTGKDYKQNELYIVEGISASGGLLKGRNKVNQAVLPLRGKLANTSNFDEERLVDNKEVLAIVNTIGCGLGGICDPSKSRYGKVIIATDLDSDGCLVGDTPISVLLKSNSEDYMKLSEIVEMWNKDRSFFDNVLIKSFNVSTRKIEYKRLLGAVLTKYVRKEDLLDYVYSNGLGTIRTTATRDHLFLTTSGNWVKLEDLNDKVENDANDPGYFDLGVQDTDFDNKGELVPVYDLEVEDNHNFFANDLVVHNSHIANLITTLFYQHAPEMIKQGLIYKLEAPYYKVESSKKVEYFYYDEKDKVDFNKNVTKLKGLGSYNLDEVKQFMTDPKNRRLIQLKWDSGLEAQIEEASKLMYSSLARRNLMLETGVFVEGSIL